MDKYIVCPNDSCNMLNGAEKCKVCTDAKFRGR